VEVVALLAAEADLHGVGVVVEAAVLQEGGLGEIVEEGEVDLEAVLELDIAAVLEVDIAAALEVDSAGDVGVEAGVEVEVDFEGHNHQVQLTILLFFVSAPPLSELQPPKTSK
jgi:hypothetical protein